MRKTFDNLHRKRIVRENYGNARKVPETCMEVASYSEGELGIVRFLREFQIVSNCGSVPPGLTFSHNRSREPALLHNHLECIAAAEFEHLAYFVNR
jgi:hypothetical protein